MTTKATIMTMTNDYDSVRVERLLSPDLFVDNPSLRLDLLSRRSMLDRPAIGAVSFVAERRAATISHDLLADACAKACYEFIAESQLLDSFANWLFCALGPWHPATAEHRRRRLLGNRPELTPLIPHIATAEQEFASPKGVRYAALFSVGADMFPSAVRLCRRDTAHFLMLAPRLSSVPEASTGWLFSAAFPLDAHGVAVTSIDWLSTCVSLTQKGFMPIRVSGSFDDREVAVDLIGPPTLLTQYLERHKAKRGS